MTKILTHSDISDLKDQVENLGDRIDTNSRQIAINSDIHDNIVQVAGLPKKLQEVSYSLLKIENNQTEADRKVEMNNKQLEELETALKRSSSIESEMLKKQETGELTFNDLVSVLNRNLEELQVTMV